MKIKPDHVQLINRLLAREKPHANQPAGGATPSAGIEQKQISSMTNFLQTELEKIDQEADPARMAMLQALRDAIERGEYRIDPEQLARAMLKHR